MASSCWDLGSTERVGVELLPNFNSGGRGAVGVPNAAGLLGFWISVSKLAAVKECFD